MNLILAAAIATIGAFHDMNYLDAKKELVEITGHPELVTDSAGGDFSDHVVPERPKAKTYLNKANRRIEESLVELKAQEERVIPVSAGQFQISVNDLRYVSRIDLETDSVRKKALTYTTLQWIRDTFLFPYHLITRGLPRWWTRLPSYNELLSNPTFDQGTTGWAFLAGNEGTLLDLGGSIRITAGASAAFYYTDFTAADLLNARVSVDVVSYTAPTNPASPVFIVQIQRPGYYAENMRAWNRLYDNSLGVFEAGFDDPHALDSRLYIVVNAGASVTINKVSLQKPVESGQASILLMPPSDAAYKAHVFGGYYAPAFENATDETWASVNCPNALMLMAKAYVSLLVEGDTKTFKELEKQALGEALERWGNSIHEQIEGIPLEEQRFGPISFGPYAGDTGAAPMYQWDDA